MKRWLRFTAAVLAAAFLFALTGCGSSTNSASFTWFVDSIPANLDPQVASGASDVIACENLYGTLVRKDPDGELVPGLCEEWTVSPDGLTYTFTLKDGLRYAAAKGAATEYDITAEDFVFAFRRIFRADTASPYAVEFSAIQNSAAVLAGLADESSLGVSANGALSLVFRLSERDDNFLAKLAMPGAAPCDEAFFESTRGTYGLTAKTTLASGSFYLYNWTTNGLFLRRTVESPLVGSLRLVQDTSGSGKSAAQLYDLVFDYMSGLTQDKESKASRMALVNKDEHIIANAMDEWLVFSNSFISLDRTECKYNLIAKITDGKVSLSINHINYIYEEGRQTGFKLPAEEVIIDKVALTKKKNDLARIFGKFRKKTIDRKDQIFNEIAALVK